MNVAGSSPPPSPDSGLESYPRKELAGNNSVKSPIVSTPVQILRRPAKVGTGQLAVPASVLNAVADWTHWLFPIALVEWTRTSYAVAASRFVMTVRVTCVGVSPRYQFVQSVVPSTRYS